MEPTRQNTFAKFAKCGTKVVRVVLGNQKNTPQILKKSTQNRSKMVPGPPWAPKVRDRGGMSGTEPPQGLIFEAPGPHLDAPRGPLGTLVAPQCALLGARASPKGAKMGPRGHRSPPRADFFRKRPTFAIPHYLRYFSEVWPPPGRFFRGWDPPKRP